MISLFLLAFHAYGATLDQLEVRKITFAKTSQQVEKIRQDAEQIRIVRLACRLQMQERMIPSSCYRALRLEEHFGMRAAKDTRAKLDQKCASAARVAQSVPVFDDRDLTRSCRNDVRKARELLAYKLESP